MEKQYKSFEELHQKVREEYNALDNVSTDFLNEKGLFMRAVYDCLDDCFRFADNKAELAVNISNEIVDLLTPFRCSIYTHDPEEKIKIANKIRRYVRFNVEKELWENLPGFQERKEN